MQESRNRPSPLIGPGPGEPEPLENARHPAVEELELLIRARYPIIYVVTWEEARLEADLQSIAARRGKKLYCWTVTTDMQPAGTVVGGRRRGLADPIDALDRVLEYKEPAIYLFKDFHPFMRGREGNVAVIRKLREVSEALSDSFKTLVISAPVMEIARELEKDVTVLDYPLPDAGELDRLLERICREVGETSTIQIDLDREGRDRLVQAALGLTLKEAENVFAKTIVQDGRLSADDVSLVFTEKQLIVRKSGLLEFIDTPTDMGEIGGLDRLKEWLTKRTSAFSEQARRFGLPPPKGVLLVGVQGCGKSLSAKAVSRLWGLPLVRFDVGRLFSSLVGASEENMRRALGVAESIAPVVLWVDEIDKSLSGAQGSANTDGGTTARVMSTFLTWLSEKERPVFVVATANDITLLPPELLRKGRLDEIFFVDLPTAAERLRIFEIHLRKRGRDPTQFDLEALAEAADGFSGAEIEEAVISGLYDAFHAERDLTTQDVLGAIRDTVPLARTMEESITALRTWAHGRARPASSPPPEATRVSRRKLEL